MEAIRSALLVAHVVAGTAAVAAGLAALLLAKGGRGHRRAGCLFVRCMAVVIGAALVLGAIRFDPYFLGLAASAVVAIFSGVRVLRRKRPDLDPAQRARALDWAVAGAVAATALWLSGLAGSGRIAGNVTVVYSIAAGCLLYAGYDLWRFARPAAFPASPRLWFYEHLVKMLGGYFGAVAAFSGSVLLVLDPPWRQLWAVCFGQALAIVLIFVHRRRRSVLVHAPG